MPGMGCRACQATATTSSSTPAPDASPTPGPDPDPWPSSSTARRRPSNSLPGLRAATGSLARRVVPAQHPQGPQGVPATGFTFGLEGEVDLAAVHLAHQPSTIGCLLVAKELDGLGDPLIGPTSDGPEVVEAAQDVVVPLRRPGELQPRLADHLPSPLAAEEVPLQEVLLAPVPGLRGRQAAARALVFQETLEHADRGVERRDGRALLGLTVPAAVLQLLTRQTRAERVDVGPEVRAGRQGAPVDARLDLAVEVRLAVVLPTTVLRHQGGGLARGTARRVEAELTQDRKAGKGGGPRLAVAEVRRIARSPLVRDPLGKARAARPLTVGVAQPEQPRAPALGLDPRSLGAHLVVGGVGEVTKHLPPDRRVSLHQPVDDVHAGKVRRIPVVLLPHPRLSGAPRRQRPTGIGTTPAS